MQQLFHRSGLRLSPTQLEQFWRFHELLRRRNAELDLTRLHSFDSMVLKLYIDSALVATLVDLPSPLLDLGTGAGFPGIPLKIVRPDVRLILAEAKHKRVAFLREVVAHLGLKGVDIVPHRIGRRLEQPPAAVITRAVETMQATLARVSPWLPLGSRVLFMKGPESQEEVETVRHDFAADYCIRLDRRYSIPQSPHQRRLVVVERVGTHLDLAAEEDRLEEDGERCDTDEGEPSPEAKAAVSSPASLSSRTLREVQSLANPTFKQLVALQSGRGIRRARMALVAGTRPIAEVLQDFAPRCLAWVSDASTPPPASLPQEIAWYRLSRELFRRVDCFGTGPPLLLVRVPEFLPWKEEDTPPGCTLFVPFQDPENVGAVLRSAAAFGVSQVVLLQEAAHPFHPRSVRAAGGSALLRLRFRSGPTIEALQPQELPLFRLSTAGRDLRGLRFPATFGLLPGLEGPGLPAAQRSPEALHIPLEPGVESLNAATAVAISLFVWRSQGALGGAAEPQPPLPDAPL
jgi:16S rRNA (guanine527-N7)-methyltransferase